MTTLTQASRQWATRPDDERYVSLLDMQQHFDAQRNNAREVVVSSRRIRAIPDADNKGLTIEGPNGHAYAPTHWAFGQLAQLADAPAGYMRTLPAPIAADCINYGMQFSRDVAEVGVLLQREEGAAPIIRAATGPKYGRIWNGDIVRGLVSRFGDGLTGAFRVPGEFGKAVEVTKANTTLYAGDRDMFVFLADEEHRIEIPNRRDGNPGLLARGFFVWNSEVGSSTFGLQTFLFDYVCCNRMVWGATDVQQVTIRHSAGAPDRYIEEMAPALTAYASGSTAPIVKLIADARAARVDNVDEFLAERFGKRMVAALVKAHDEDEGRPIESLWDVSNAVTAYARNIGHQDRRVELERAAGKIIQLAT